MEKYNKTATILYVEDEDKIREGYSKPILRCSKELFTASNGEEGLELFKKYKPDIVITDIKMPKMSGIDMVKNIKEINPNTRIIFTTAHGESEYLFKAIELHADSYLLKPVPSKVLKHKILSLCKSILLEKINILQQAQIEEQQKLLQNIINTEKNISVVTNFNKISFVNNAFLDFFKIENIEQFYEVHDTFLDSFNKEDGFLFKDLITNSTTTNNIEIGEKFYNHIQNLNDEAKIVSLLNSELESKYFFINISLMDKEKNLYLLTLTDITKINIQKTNAQKQANTDELTGLYNRNKFKEVFKKEITRSIRYKKSLSIAIFDIDHFKDVNDNHGHLVGDEVLKTIANVVSRNIRKSDLFVRWGGEEFILIFTEINLTKAIKASDILRKKIENLNHDMVGKVTVSFGVTQFQNGDNQKTMIERCDKALYLAKESGRNCVKSL